MARSLRSAVVVCLCTSSIACAAASGEPDPPFPGVASQAATDEAENTRAILALLEAHERHWNRHDMDGWAEILHEDADWVHWRGGLWRGKREIQAGHEEIHRTYYRSSRVSPQRLEDLTFLTPDIALAHVRSELSGDARAPGETFSYRKTILFTKKDGAWRIRALHNTRLQGVDVSQLGVPETTDLRLKEG